MRDGAVATDWFDYLFVSPAEFAEFVAESPWRVDDIYDDIYDDSPNYGVRLRLR